jgi:photosystem II stability/assembly factor-like uncharacterized protein
MNSRRIIFSGFRILFLKLVIFHLFISLNAQTVDNPISEKREGTFLKKIVGSENRKQKRAKAQFRKTITSHAYYTNNSNEKDWKMVPKPERPDLAREQDFLRTLDPKLGYPPSERLIPVYKKVNTQLKSGPGSPVFPWVERGPSNVGGRTRALMFDPNYPIGTRVWAGGTSGGLWSNVNITGPEVSWINVDDFWSNISITCMDYDPGNTQVFYVGTGESVGSAANKGAGIWKSTDGGQTWNHLPASSNFYYINDLQVRRENGQGVLYVAVSGYSWWATDSIAPNLEGLFRSTDGGEHFTQVFPGKDGHPYAARDIEIGSNNRLWIGTIFNTYGDFGGKIYYSDNGTNWVFSDSVTGCGRVELAVAPSNPNYVYAIYERGGRVNSIRLTTDNGATWRNKNEPADADNGIPNTDFSRGQAKYDLIIAVDPNNPRRVIAGAINLFYSTDSATNWAHISKWSNNPSMGPLTCSTVHADQHAIVFKPGSSSEVIFGNDGGVYYTDDLTNAATNDVISPRNKNYNVTQFYACAIHPDEETNYFLAGAQDNGTPRFQSLGMNQTTFASGGDGGLCFIDQTNPRIQITSYVNNSYYVSVDGGDNFTQVISDRSSGSFINPCDYDNYMNLLYTSMRVDSIYRITPSVTPTFNSLRLPVVMDCMASIMRISPYTTNSSTLFIGTLCGYIYRIRNAQGNAPQMVKINTAGLPAGSVSCIEFGRNENEMLVTFFNYGIPSVWFTADGGAHWSNKEGDLPDMPVRWAMFNPYNNHEAILATEVGVWISSNLQDDQPNWRTSKSGLANVRVDMLKRRESDLEVIAATHGRGLFSGQGFENISVGNPVASSQWKRRSRQLILWALNTSQNHNVNIDLYRGSVFVSRIASNYNGDGMFDWNIPEDIQPDTTYYIKVTNSSDVYLYGISAKFSILEEDYILVTSPADTSTWKRGTVKTIRWDSNVTDSIRIDLLNGNSYVHTIAAKIANTGTFNWAIPDSLVYGRNYQVKVSSVKKPSLYDSSEPFFTIYELDYIRLIYPRPHSVWHKGLTYELFWQTNVVGAVNLDLYRNNVLVAPIVHNRPSQLGSISYNWTVPAGITQDTTYTIRIRNLSNADIADTSSLFTIRNPKQINIIKPDTNTVWGREVPQNVIWSDNIEENVILMLFQGGVFRTALSSFGVPSNGTFQWSIPAHIRAGRGYQLRIIGQNVESWGQHFEIKNCSNSAVNLGNDTSVYLGNSLNIDAGRFDKYLWNTGDTGRIHTVVGSVQGNYAYSVATTDSAGCSHGSDTILVSVKKMVDSFAGVIANDTSWCNVDTVKITGDVTIADGASLSICPGTTIKFMGHYMFNVQGRLVAIGEEKKPIRFTVNDTTGFNNFNNSLGSWYGIRFDNTPATNDSSLFRYCRFEHAKASESGLFYQEGGALYVKNFDKVAVSNCILENNAAGTGGAIYLNNAAINIRFSTIGHNKAKYYGAGMFVNANALISGCSISYNEMLPGSSTYGAALGIWEAMPQLESNIISYNSGASFGGAIYSAYSKPKIIGNIISNNKSNSTGGAISISDSIPILVNNVIANNTADGSGGAIVAFNSDFILTNNTIANNYAPMGGAFALSNSSPDIKNTIIWGNDAGIGNQFYIFDDQSDPYISNSNLQGGKDAMEGNGAGVNYDSTRYSANNIEDNPRFVAPTQASGIGYNALTANWRINKCSPCINKGTLNTAGLNIPITDFVLAGRIYRDTIDIGACEVQYVKDIMPVITAHPQSALRCVGQLRHFETDVTGQNLYYRWFFNGDSVPEEHESEYSIYNIEKRHSGNYHCIVSNDCGTDTSNIATLTVYIYPKVDLGPDIQTCYGDTIYLDAGFGESHQTYRWQNGSTSQYLQTDTAGKYHVTIDNYCGRETDTINIAISKQLVLNLGSDFNLCPGDTVVLDAFLGASMETYSWQDKSGDPKYTVTKPGKYAVIVRNFCDTLSDEVIATAVTPMDIYLGKDTTITSKDIIVLSAKGYTNYLWNDSSTTSSLTVKGSELIPFTDNAFYLRAKDTNNCEVGDTILIRLKDNTSIGNINSYIARMYPNPSNGYVYIDVLAPIHFDVIIYSMDNRQVYRKEFTASGKDTKTLDVKHLRTGSYIIRIVDIGVPGNGSVIIYTGKLIIL